MANLFISNFEDGILKWDEVKHKLSNVRESETFQGDKLPHGFLDVFLLWPLDFAFRTLFNSPEYPKFVELAPQMGEMYLQTFVMNLLTSVVLAATSPNAATFYNADELVKSGNFKKVFDDGAEYELAHIDAKSDAAALLQECLVLCTAEFKTTNLGTSKDKFKGLIFALVFVLYLAGHGIKGIYAPFFTSNGIQVELFVAFVSAAGDGTPSVRRVQAPEIRGPFDLYQRVQRLNFSGILFALLGAAKVRLRGQNLPTLVVKTVRNALESPSKRRRTNKNRASGGDDPSGGADDEEAQGGVGQGDVMQHAATALSGHVQNLRPVFSRNAVSESSDSSEAPHDFFYGTDCNDGSEVFVKVKSRRCSDDVDDEVEMLRRAGSVDRCRVPKLVYHVETERFDIIVMEFVKNYAVDRGSVRAFAASLIGAIISLHARDILHCDLKPDNAVWDGESVAIVDFGHAQLIKGAQSYRGTHGFTAPEVAVDEKPHSTASDSFSVGKTLEEVVKQAGAQGDETLAAIVAGLTKADVVERLTLSDALEMLSPSQVSSPPPKKPRIPIVVSPPAPSPGPI